MIKGYRHLDSKSVKKIIFHEKLKAFMKKTFKWWMIIAGILLLFAIWLISFYLTLDKIKTPDKKEVTGQSANFKTLSSQDDTANLNELSKKELERESKKEQGISDSTKEKDYEFDTDFYDFGSWNKSCSTELLVVNSKNKLPADFKPETKNCRGKEVSVIMADDLEKMICDAKKEGISLWISSGYRNIDYQTRLFNRQIDREKSKEVITNEEAEKRAAKVVAKPYTSEHNTGLAIDFNGVSNDFYKTKEYKWLMDNAAKYGFIERYQKKWKSKTGVIYEPWHFRYVGKKHAPLIKETGLCLEDYVKINLIENKSEENSL